MADASIQQSAIQPRRHQTSWPLGLSPLGLVFASVACVAAAALLYLTQASRVATSGYDMSSLEQHRAQLLRERQQLLVRLAEAQSLTHVEETARSDLGMVRSRNERFLTATVPSLDVEAEVRASQRAAVRSPRTWRQRLAAVLATGAHGWNRLRGEARPSDLQSSGVPR